MTASERLAVSAVEQDTVRWLLRRARLHPRCVRLHRLWWEDLRQVAIVATWLHGANLVGARREFDRLVYGIAGRHEMPVASAPKHPRPCATPNCSEPGVYLNPIGRLCRRCGMRERQRRRRASVPPVAVGSHAEVTA